MVWLVSAYAFVLIVAKIRHKRNVAKCLMTCGLLIHDLVCVWIGFAELIYSVGGNVAWGKLKTVFVGCIFTAVTKFSLLERYTDD